jgi:DNA-3-methyladenine glycosylase II
VVTQFEIEPRGPFSLAAAAGFGFAGTIGAPAFDGALRLAFVTDDLRHHAGVLLRQDAGETATVRGELLGGGGDDDAVRAQVARILSLDHDGRAWLAVGERDAVIGRLQGEHPGLRPVLFHSPYEAAAWSIISARRPAVQAAAVRDQLARELGTSFQLDGAALAAFPLPERLLGCAERPGLPPEKVARLHAVARAALDGQLDADRLRALDPAAALADLQTLKGIGPFYAQLLHIRSTGVTDALVDEPRVLASTAHLYGLPHPPDRAAFAELAEPWRPFRTWATVLLRVAGDRAGVSRR